METEQTVTKKQKPTTLVVTSYVLIILTCLFSLIPAIGFITWVHGIPILLITFILGIIAITKGSPLNGPQKKIFVGEFHCLNAATPHQ